MGNKLSTKGLKVFQILESVGANQPKQPSSRVKELGPKRTNIYRLLATRTETDDVAIIQEGLNLRKREPAIPLNQDLRKTTKPLTLNNTEQIKYPVSCESNKIKSHSTWSHSLEWTLQPLLIRFRTASDSSFRFCPVDCL